MRWMPAKLVLCIAITTMEDIEDDLGDQVRLAFSVGQELQVVQCDGA